MSETPTGAIGTYLVRRDPALVGDDVRGHPACVLDRHFPAPATREYARALGGAQHLRDRTSGAARLQPAKPGNKPLAGVADSSGEALEQQRDGPGDHEKCDARSEPMERSR